MSTTGNDGPDTAAHDRPGAVHLPGRRSARAADTSATSAEPAEPAELAALAARLRQLDSQVAVLGGEIDQLHRLLHRAGGLLAALALLTGLLVPFLVSTDDDTMTLATTARVLGDYEDEAGFASALLWIYLVGAIATLIGVLVLTVGRPAGAARTVLRALCVTFGVGALCSWMFLLTLVGQLDDGDATVSRFSPANLALTVGAVLACAVAFSSWNSAGNDAR